jgi:hypothetical protein
MQEFGERKQRALPIGTPACMRCRYWAPSERISKEVGQCRRSAPMQSGWPDTGKDEWCGDYSASRAAGLGIAMSFLKLAVAVSAFALFAVLGLVNLKR